MGILIASEMISLVENKSDNITDRLRVSFTETCNQPAKTVELCHHYWWLCCCVKDLFENVLVDNIINFIKEINFYNQL